ncbi:hypothetical protein BDQ17DRAFT_1437125 [Cyathus striatus]|nr:hypothetical protein BDQ17DRAFT_1437125 [Cyathus striatus]
MGLFHAALNLAWALLHIHPGTLSQQGSLTYWFAILEKTHLGGQKPDYHTLYATLTQILEGVVLSAWKKICTEDGSTIEIYAKSKPAPEDLHNKAGVLLEEYLMPLPSLFSAGQNTDDTDNSDTFVLSSGNTAVPPPIVCEGQVDPLKDKVHWNLCLLM